MQMSERNEAPKDKLVEAYRRMLERVRASDERTTSGLKAQVEAAKQEATRSHELTPEEAEQVGESLKKDIDAAASFLVNSDHETMADWLRFDLQLAESALAQLFVDVVDQSRVELAQWQQQGLEWQTGEITGIGVLECLNCGALLEFRHTARIPACPRCAGSRFRKQFSGFSV